MDEEHEKLEAPADRDKGELELEGDGWPVPDVPPGPVGPPNQVWPADDGAPPLDGRPPVSRRAARGITPR